MGEAKTTDRRTLLIMTRELAPFLAKEEMMSILMIYYGALKRMERDNDEYENIENTDSFIEIKTVENTSYFISIGMAIMAINSICSNGGCPPESECNDCDCYDCQGCDKCYEKYLMELAGKLK